MKRSSSAPDHSRSGRRPPSCPPHVASSLPHSVSRSPLSAAGGTRTRNSADNQRYGSESAGTIRPAVAVPPRGARGVDSHALNVGKRSSRIARSVEGSGPGGSYPIRRGAGACGRRRSGKTTTKGGSSTRCTWRRGGDRGRPKQSGSDGPSRASAVCRWDNLAQLRGDVGTEITV